MEVSFNQAESRFEVQLAGASEPAVLDVRKTPDSWTLRHTGVPSSHSGRGVGGALVKAALAAAREAGVLVKPVCPFTAAYIKRHPEELDLVHPEWLHAVER